MKRLALYIGLFIGFGAFAQQDTLATQWVVHDSIRVGKGVEWTVDVLQNYYISERGVLNKYDSTGVLKFSQSIKSIGELSDLLVINTMKLVYFSEEQQVLCYLDNTLARNEDCLLLSDRNIVSATKVARSDRSNRIWIYDEVNSSLSLIDTEDENVKPFIVENVLGLIGNGEVAEMVESGGKLYINIRREGIYVFDIYGSLADKINVLNADKICADQTGLYVLLDNHLDYYTNSSDRVFHLELPRENVVQFKLSGSYIFLESGDFVYKYLIRRKVFKCK